METTMKVDYEEYHAEALKVARVRGVISAWRIMQTIDRRFGVDTKEVDRLLDALERELGDG